MDKQKKTKSLYAIPCSYGDPYGQGIFFTTFHTKDENEALRLASCIHGKKGKRSLVIITENGDVIQL